MKFRPTGLVAVALVAISILTGGLPAIAPGPRAALAAPETFAIDPVHSEVGFKIRHFVSKVPGRFNRFEGIIVYDAEKPDAGSIRATIETASIDTKNEKRDNHLRSADFFEVEKFPTMTFVSKAVKFDGNTFTATGDLTIRGVTRPLTLSGEMAGVIPVAPGEKRAGFSATGTIDRKDFGILWNKTLDQGGTVLGDEVEIRLEVAAQHSEPKAEEAGGAEKAAEKAN